MKFLRDHLYYHWWVYVISAVCVVALWLSVFGKLSQSAANEQINITYFGSSFDHISLQSDLYQLLPEKTMQNIKRISVENAVIEGEYDLNTLLRARISGNCDFFIIENAVLEEYEIDLASYFSPLESGALERLFGGAEQVEQNGKTYGIACGGHANITRYYSGSGSCQIFFNVNSVNLSDLSGGDKMQDAAIQAALYLTEDRNVSA